MSQRIKKRKRFRQDGWQRLIELDRVNRQRETKLRHFNSHGHKPTKQIKRFKPLKGLNRLGGVRRRNKLKRLDGRNNTSKRRKEERNSTDQSDEGAKPINETKSTKRATANKLHLPGKAAKRLHGTKPFHRPKLIKSTKTIQPIGLSNTIKSSYTDENHWTEQRH